MFKEINWKSVFKGFAWTVSLVGLVVLMSFVEAKKHTITCKQVKILIPGADNFIEREEIDAVLKQSEGSLIGRSLEQINLHAIEKKIKSNPYIAKATVYADMDGVIHIEIKQRQPILRVINVKNQDYYIDRDGLKMPVSLNFTANVLAANGNILEFFGGRVDTLVTKVAADLYKTALFIKKDTLWDAQIEQIYVNDKSDIELIPRVGNQRIIVGSADSLDIKMRNLLAFYKQAMPKVGWDTYKTINIKYTNQVVCERNKPDSLARSVPRRPRITDTLRANAGVVSDLVRQQIAMEMQNDGIPPEEGAPAVTVEKPVVKPKPVPAPVKAVTAAATKPRTADTAKPKTAGTASKPKAKVATPDKQKVVAATKPKAHVDKPKEHHTAKPKTPEVKTKTAEKEKVAEKAKPKTDAAKKATEKKSTEKKSVEKKDAEKKSEVQKHTTAQKHTEKKATAVKAPVKPATKPTTAATKEKSKTDTKKSNNK